MGRFGEDRYLIVSGGLGPVSAFRMFLLIVEAGLLSVFIVDPFTVFLGSLPFVLLFGLFLVPFMLFAGLFSMLMAFISLPYFLFAALPLSLLFYRKGVDNPLAWIGMFSVLPFFYLGVIGVLFGKADVVDALPHGSVFLLHAGLTGWRLWVSLFGKRFLDPKNPETIKGR